MAVPTASRSAVKAMQSLSGILYAAPPPSRAAIHPVSYVPLQAAIRPGHQGKSEGRSSARARQVCLSGMGVPAQVVAYQESSPIRDWRVQEMVDLCHTYFQELWTEGNLGVAEKVLDAGFVHHDEVWRKSQLVVGPTAFKKFVKVFREGYPDLLVRPVDYSTSDNTRVYVRWEGSATNLGRFRGREPTRHSSSISGITSFGFNHDRSRIKEAIVYRSPTAEEKEEWSTASDPLDVQLARLNFG